MTLTAGISIRKRNTTHFRREKTPLPSSETRSHTPAIMQTIAAMHIKSSIPTPENSEKTVMPAITRRAIREVYYTC